MLKRLRLTPGFPFGKGPGEKGQVLVLVGGILVILLAFAGLGVDIGHYLDERAKVQNAVDAAALAGAQDLPDDGAAAQASALQYAQANDPDLAPANLDISFRCLAIDLADASTLCPQVSSGSFTLQNGVYIAPCTFSGPTAKCNVIVVGGSKDVPFYLLPVLTVIDDSDQCFYDECSTGSVRAAACSGGCGAPPTGPLDVIMVVDRTSSMSDSLNCISGVSGDKEIDCARQGARQVLGIYNPAMQYVGLGLIGPSKSTASCSGANSPGKGLAASTTTEYNNGLWVPVGLTGVGAPVNEAYKNADGTLNTNSLLVKTVDWASVGSTCLTTSGVGTNLSTPMQKAREYLVANGRPDVKHGIIFMTDGAPNYNSRGTYAQHTCQAAFNEAQAAKTAGIEVFTIAYGISGENCPDGTGSYPGSSYNGKKVTKLLADMATSSVDETGCDTAAEAAQENADGDHFLCQPSGSDMSVLFKQAAEALAGGVRLIRVPN